MSLLWVTGTIFVQFICAPHIYVVPPIHISLATPLHQAHKKSCSFGLQGPSLCIQCLCRRERYLIIHLWKIQGQIMNLSNPILSCFSPRRGCYFETFHVKHGRISSLRFNSYRLKSCRLRNCLPSKVVLIIFGSNPLVTNTSNCLDPGTMWW